MHFEGGAPHQHRSPVRKGARLRRLPRLRYAIGSLTATALLRPILQDPDADPMVVQAILFGIIRAQTDVGPQIVDGLQFIRNIDARNWTLLIKARSNQPMTDRELKNLGFIVQGSGNIPDTFRLQAAWSYLKRTGQANAALEQVLSRQQSAP